MELLGKPGIIEDELAKVVVFVEEWPMIGLVDTIMEKAIILRRERRLMIPDAIIAAAATYLNADLITADKDFLALEDLLPVVMYIQ